SRHAPPCLRAAGHADRSDAWSSGRGRGGRGLGRAGRGRRSRRGRVPLPRRGRRELSPATGRLAGKVALVTGASPGIGPALAQAFAREGAAVALAARNESELEDAAREVEAAGGRALVLPADVSDPDQAARLSADAVARLGRLDILVNNAGVGARGRVDEL